MASRVKRGYKFRFYPTARQAELLGRTFGWVRKVYNLALHARTEASYQRRERVNYTATSAMLTASPARTGRPDSAGPRPTGVGP